MKKKCIVFGCGNIGKISFYKLDQIYDIVAYTDNNKELWGEKLNGKKIVSPKELQKLNRENMIQIVIAVMNYQPIYEQLKVIGIQNIIVMKLGFLYKINEVGVLCPIEDIVFPFIKAKKGKTNVLFIQTSPCIRTNKIARLLKEKGIRVFLAYLIMDVQTQKEIENNLYEYYYPIHTLKGLISFINNSEINIVHSSNEPDLLTALLTNSNKTIIHDCHDLSSAYKSMSPDEMAVEYIANVKSQGVIYTTEGIREVACKKFAIDKSRTFVLENLISEELQPERRLEKLSHMDGELHCVYEGGIIGGDMSSHRYFEDIWKKITDCGIHIHFYSPSDSKYCKYLESTNKYLHFEGNYSSKELAVEMSKYDIGLCILNINETNKQYLEFASPNKVQEYVNAGLPVVVNNIQSLVNYVEKNQFGKCIDMSRDIKKQLEKIVKINIPEKVLQKKGLTLESKIPELISFYQRCLTN